MPRQIPKDKEFVRVIKKFGWNSRNLLRKSYEHYWLRGTLLRKDSPKTLISFVLRRPYPNNDRKKFVRKFVNTYPASHLPRSDEREEKKF